MVWKIVCSLFVNSFKQVEMPGRLAFKPDVINCIHQVMQHSSGVCHISWTSSSTQVSECLVCDQFCIVSIVQQIDCGSPSQHIGTAHVLESTCSRQQHLNATKLFIMLYMYIQMHENQCMLCRQVAPCLDLAGWTLGNSTHFYSLNMVKSLAFYNIYMYYLAGASHLDLHFTFS